MFVRVRVNVFFCQSEIHYVQSFVFFHTRPTINTSFSGDIEKEVGVGGRGV